MIICFECTAKTKDELDNLLRSGGYRDYSEAIALAVSNQLLLHQKQADVAEIPTLFQMVGAEFRPSSVGALPSDVFTRGQRITVDRWVFGQYNKLLPLKASIRALANLSVAQRGGVPLTKAATEIAMASEYLGAYLRKIDQDLGLLREEALATAFPSAATDINKSRLRFSNQFVGALNKHGQLRGFPIDLKLVNYENPKDPRLVLTEAGWALASLANPTLDRAAKTGGKLSEEERAFLIQHIRNNVPVEDFAIRVVLGAIEAGASNPDDLNNALKGYMPERTDEPFSPAFLSTQRAGAISRMTDLALVERQREGLRVVYAVSGAGKKYLECATAA